MPSARRVHDIKQAIADRQFPSVTTWNRLEARPRTIAFDRALRAEVADALWMLTKQWQMGEFRGSDAGSPVFAKLQVDTTTLTKYQPGGLAAQPFETDVPLEAKVEQRAIPLEVSFDLRLAMGRQWLAMIKGIGGGYRQAFIDAYKITAPDPASSADVSRCAQPEVWQLFAAVAGRAMDGGALYLYLTADPAHHAYDGVAGVAAGDHGAIDAAAGEFIAWFRRLLRQPTTQDDAWIPPRLEYQFATSAPLTPATEKVYAATGYYQGRLDWYSVDVDPGASLGPVPGSPGPPTANPPLSMIPVPVSFAGMPNTRWWAFEDRKTNFGDISASTTDLAKLLFLEFALVFSNDWFVIPYTLPSGSIATINGFVVQNTFGERFWISAAGSAADQSWQHWSMFTVNVLGGGPADTSLVLLPTTSKVQQGPPAEDVWLVRDEVANMVWGIEKTVPLASGDSKPGLEVAKQTLAYLQGLVPPPAGPGGQQSPADAVVRYEVMTTVPENWIPFIPVHVTGDNREIQLQRGAMPRILEGDPNPPAKVQPRTVLLRQGLDAAQPYFVHEEEVARAGTRVLQAYQRTRWTDGQVYTWLRVVRQTGRGEGSSGLAFDQSVPVPPSGSMIPKDKGGS